MVTRTIAAMSTTSQLSCFSLINCKFQLDSRSVLPPWSHSKLQTFQSFVLRLDGYGANTASFQLKSSVRNSAKKPFIEVTTDSYEDTEGDVPEKLGKTEPVGEHSVTQQKRAAKIHDFCFGIPYGALVLSGGLVGFMFSRNPATLFFGGALLALSFFSLKIWRQGKSSLPFILGQAALAAALLWKNIGTYSLTRKLFPSGFYAAISAAMLCFYSYVVISGGNPPPKKLKLSASE